MPTIERHDPSWRFDSGATVVSDTASHTGRWRGLQALGSGCTIGSVIAADLDGDLANQQIPAGVIIHARLTTVQLIAGSCLLYR